MNLKELNPLIKVYGNTNFRGDCPNEDAGANYIFNELKRLYPDLARIAIHPDNEGLVLGTGHLHHAKQKAKGAINKGAADIIIVAVPLLFVK